MKGGQEGGRWGGGYGEVTVGRGQWEGQRRRRWGGVQWGGEDTEGEMGRGGNGEGEERGGEGEAGGGEG